MAAPSSADAARRKGRAGHGPPACIGCMADGGAAFLLSDGRALAVFALSFIAMAGFGWSAIYIMLGAAAVGLSYLLF